MRNVYWSRASVCLSVCLFPAAFLPHYCTDPDVTWENGRGCSLVVQYCASIANPPNSAQLEDTAYHSPNLHLGTCSSVGMRRGTDG